MGMHVGKIIFSKFQGKYEKKNIYNFKIVVKKKNLLRMICKKIII